MKQNDPKELDRKLPPNGVSQVSNERATNNRLFLLYLAKQYFFYAIPPSRLLLLLLGPTVVKQSLKRSQSTCSAIVSLCVELW